MHDHRQTSGTERDLGGTRHAEEPVRGPGAAFGLGIALNLAYVALETAFGFLSGSIALLADAGHNLSDVLALTAAWLAWHLAGRAPSGRFTYGLKGAPILASLFNAVLILVAMGAILWESVRRLVEPAPLDAGTVIWVASVGLVVNAGTALLLRRRRHEDINVRGAFLHMAADAGVTLGVLLAAVGIALTGWRWLDPAISIAVVAVVLRSTWGLLRGAVRMSLQAVPDHIELDAVRDFLASREAVDAVHDLHVWPLSTTDTALTAHLVVDEGMRQPNGFLAQVCADLRGRFGIDHATLQLEAGEPRNPCGLASPETV